MSLRFPPKAILLLLGLFAFAGAAIAHTLDQAPKHASQAMQPPAAADDSSRAANEMLLFLRGLYGGVDNWSFIEGMRYYATFRIPGPDSTQVSEWTEAHMVSGWHHHGDYETSIYVVRGSLRMESGGGGFQVVDARPGDFLYVPRGAIHREGKPGSEESHLVVVRAGRGPTVINVDGPAAS